MQTVESVAADLVEVLLDMIDFAKHKLWGQLVKKTVKAQPWMDRIVVSPCSNPLLGWEGALSAYSKLGYKGFEVFTSWTKSCVDLQADPHLYRSSAASYGMALTSMHLPALNDDLETSVPRAIAAARFADRLGVEIVLYKADTRSLYIKGAPAFLDGIADLPVTPVLQNHAGTVLSTLSDFREVIDGIADYRMKTLLEVGHFHTVGVSWSEGLDLLGESVHLVHIKDQIGPQSVPFGLGEIDLPGLLGHMKSAGYGGRFVVEMEVADPENTIRYLSDALEYLNKHRESLE